MKPFVLILFAAGLAQAQTIADTARHERARQAQAETTKVFTTEDIMSKESRDALDAKPVETSTRDATAGPGDQPAQAARAPEADFIQQWQQETTKLRTQAADLTAREIATQREMDVASAQMNAPRTTQSAKDQAARAIEASHQKLQEIEAELAKTRRDLESKDLQGPQQKKQQDDRPRFFP